MEPWAHVAHKDGRFAGVISHDGSVSDPKKIAQWKNEVAKFCGDFIANGYVITTVYSRGEYQGLLDTLNTHDEQEPAAGE